MTLARARRSVLVVDAGEPRNASAGHVHNYLTRDGIPAVPGVWVAGNVADVRAHVIAAAAAGMNAAVAINTDIIADETRGAVHAYRHSVRTMSEAP